jgi:hypothetical protein
LQITPTELGAPEWAVFVAEAPPYADVVLDEEHDRFQWVPAEEAARVCLPAMVGRSVAAVEAWLESGS